MCTPARTNVCIDKQQLCGSVLWWGGVQNPKPAHALPFLPSDVLPVLPFICWAMGVECSQLEDFWLYTQWPSQVSRFLFMHGYSSMGTIGCSPDSVVFNRNTSFHFWEQDWSRIFWNTIILMFLKSAVVLCLSNTRLKKLMKLIWVQILRNISRAEH